MGWVLQANQVVNFFLAPVMSVLHRHASQKKNINSNISFLIIVFIICTSIYGKP